MKFNKHNSCDNTLTPIGIVIVSYRTTKKTIEYVVEELSKINNPKIIVIVNNQYLESDESIYKASLNAEIIYDIGESIDKKNDIYVINASDNLGFARGNNLGADFLIGNFKPKYILFSNNDISIQSFNIIEELIAKAETDLKIGIIGPRMIDENGYDVSPRYDRVHPLRYAFWHILYPIRQSQILSIIGVNTPGFKEISSRNHEGYCYWVAGSFMMIKTQVFIQIGGFDFGTFLYAEEKILAERLNKHGYGIYYYPNVCTISFSGYTTTKYLSEREKEELIFQSDIHYYKHYFKINWIVLNFLKLSHFIYFSIYYKIYKKSN
jgi:GT2 family glycosyltransferase